MMIYKSTFIVAVLVMCASFGVVRADVKYTVVTKYSFARDFVDSSNKTDQTTDTKTYFVASNKTRREDVTDYTIAPTKEVFILRCDLKKQFRIDDALKIYTISDWFPSGFNSPASESELKENIPESKTITHYSIQKLAPEKVNGFDTECYQVIETNKLSGYGGNREYVNTMKIWVSDVQGWQPCDQEKISLPTSYTHIVTFPEGRRRMIEEYTGDIVEMNKISNGFPVRTESAVDYDEKASGNNTADQNVTSYLPDKTFKDSLFEVPAGYRKVSSDEYEKLRSKAEIDAIRKAKKATTQQ